MQEEIDEHSQEPKARVDISAGSGGEGESKIRMNLLKRRMISLRTRNAGCSHEVEQIQTQLDQTAKIQTEKNDADDEVRVI